MTIAGWVPYALVVVILLGESVSLKGRADAPSKDRGSYLFLRVIQAVAYFVCFWMFGARRLPAALALGGWAVWAGAAVNVGGTIFRVWAIRTLGRFFSRAVHVSADQTVVQDGPYRLLRHPSYTGALLAALGVGLSMANLLPALLLPGAFAVGLLYRIPVEERAMLETLGDAYRDYMKRTKRLLPYVF